MDHDLPPARPVAFILHILAGAVGSLSGHIHHLRTGEKRKFEDVQELGTVLLEMVNRTATDTEPS